MIGRPGETNWQLSVWTANAGAIMSTTPTPAPSRPASAGERLYRLSDLMKRRVLRGNEKIGSLTDLVIGDKEVVAEVTHVCVNQPFGRPKLYIPWRFVEELAPKAV